MDYSAKWDLENLPRRVDWRHFGVVAPVQSQGSCGACWAFAAVSTLESQLARRSGNLLKLSEQQLIDCSKSPHANGCKGGHVYEALHYLATADGVTTASQYPYAKRNQTCLLTRATPLYGRARSYVALPAGDELALQEAVARVGPVAVKMDAHQFDFKHYSGGVYYDEACTEHLRHSVVVVGYGTDGESGEDYWLVRNSWGSRWGEEGYARVARNRRNHCGIATAPFYPVV